MNPRLSDKFAEELFDFIESEEKTMLKVYVCSQHVPTIGVGYALLERAGKTFKTRSGLDADLKKIGKALTAADNKRLAKLCQMLNDGTIQQAIMGNSPLDPFDLTVDRDQAKELFRICIVQYDDFLKKRLGLKLYNTLKNSKEMICLLSLAYNAQTLIGDGLVEALRQGNRAKVQYEILYGSNKKREIGIDDRRQDEAKMFGRYDGETPTAEELRAEEEVQKEHGAQKVAYTSQMDAKRKGRMAKRAKGVKTASGKAGKGLQVGANPHQKAVRRRVDEAKAHRSHHGNSILQRIQDLWDTIDDVMYRDWNYHPSGLHEKHYHKRWS